jgi:hypothetical protein
MMKPAVRDEKACALLLRKTAVPALDTAIARSRGLILTSPLARRTKTARPSRSTIAMTASSDNSLARATACEKIISKSLRLSVPSASSGLFTNPAKRRNKMPKA